MDIKALVCGLTRYHTLIVDIPGITIISSKRAQVCERERCICSKCMRERVSAYIDETAADHLRTCVDALRFTDVDRLQDAHVDHPKAVYPPKRMKPAKMGIGR